MYASGFVLILCLVGVSVAQDEFGDSASHQPMISDDPLNADQPVFDHSSNEIYKKEPQDLNAACRCSGRWCTCCRWIYVSSVSYQYTCVKFRYYRCTKTFSTSVQIGYRSYYAGTISLFRPLTRCAKVYVFYAKQWIYLCVHLTSLTRSRYKVHGRALLSVYSRGKRIGHYNLGWFSVSNTAEMIKLADDQRPDMIEAADDSDPAPQGFRDNAVDMEILEEPLTADAIEARQGVPPPGFLDNPVVMENMAEPLENNRMV